MKLQLSSLTVFFMVLVLGLNAQDQLSCYVKDPKKDARERFVDFKHAHIDLRFVPDSGRVNGSVRLKFEVLRPQLDSLYLDATQMKVHLLQADSSESKYRVSDQGITVYFDQPLARGENHEVFISYSAWPRKGMFFIGWQDSTNRCRKQIWTQGQGIDNRRWVPLFDDMADKITTDITVHFDSTYQVLSNGKFILRMNEGKETFWHYHMEKPHSPYLMMLAIGDYGIWEQQSASGVKLYNYYYPGFPAKVEPTYRYNKEIFDYLEENIGIPYPWPTYSQVPVQDFVYGAMENTSATIFGDFFWVDSVGFNDKNYVYVNGHELAHQWFGDLVTSRSPDDHWLHESFATYYHTSVVREFLGQDDFEVMMRNNQQAALQADQTDHRGVGHSAAGSARFYLKGSYVLHMLNYTVGDELFREALKHYLVDHAYGLVSRDDLIGAFYESTGYPIGWFIDQWVNHGGMPQYEVKWETDKKAKKYRMVVNQLQDTVPEIPLFRMPVVVEVYYTDGSRDSLREWVDGKSDTILIERDKKKEISYVLFDPGSKILKQISFDRSLTWRLNQATEAAYMIDRYDALVSLRKTAMEDKEATLIKAFTQDSAYFSRGEALTQLWNHKDSIRWIREAIASNDPDLQKVVLRNTRKIPAELQADYEKLLNASSYEVIQTALVRLAMSFPGNIQGYLTQTSDVQGGITHNVRIQWLEIAVHVTGDSAYYNELVDLSTESFDFQTRTNAVRTLQRLNYLDEAFIQSLFTGIQNANWRLAGVCGNALKKYYQSQENKALIDEVRKKSQRSESALKRVDHFLSIDEKK
ncbi:hypothetical protein KFE98_15390 [bacterium SCSIO 12741]|nr:hypothetical protein KFE98_15390 [bacterium SCSIO 12741]